MGAGDSVTGEYDITSSGVGSWVANSTVVFVVGDTVSNAVSAAEGSCVGVSVLDIGKYDAIGTFVGTSLVVGVGAIIAGVGVSGTSASIEGACVGTVVDGIGVGGRVTTQVGIGGDRAATGDGAGTDVVIGGGRRDQRVNLQT